jgi:hypothetical protein
MSEYSEINIRESIAPGVDKKPIVKENATVDWNIDTLVKYFEMMRKKKGNGGQSHILPSSPETFTLS